MIIHPSETHVVILVVITVSVLQGPLKDVHMARGFSYKKSVRQIPAHRDLYRDIRKESIGNMVSLGKDSIPFQIKDLGISNIFTSTDYKIVINVITLRTSMGCLVISGL